MSIQIAYLTSYWKQVTQGRADLDPAFARHLRDIARPSQIAFVRLMRHSNGKPAGVEMRCTERQAWQVVLPNPVPEGADPSWRVLYFDASGFCGHVNYHRSEQEAVEAMLMSGYTVIDQGALQRCASQEAWSKGMAIQALRDQYNRCEIDFPTMARLAAAV